jgi:hypothetical protein
MYKITVPVTHSTVLQFSAVLQRGHNNNRDPVKFTPVPAYKKKPYNDIVEATMSFSTPAKSACTVPEIISARIGVAIASSRPTSTYLAAMTFLTSSKYLLSSTTAIFYLLSTRKNKRFVKGSK